MSYKNRLIILVARVCLYSDIRKHSDTLESIHSSGWTELFIFYLTQYTIGQSEHVNYYACMKKTEIYCWHQYSNHV